MHYAEFTPPEKLSGAVRCFWTLDGDTPASGSAEPAMPDGSPELIVNLADPWMAEGREGVEVAQPEIILVGQITKPFAVRPTGRVRLVAARLSPFGAAYLRRPVAGYTDTWIDLSDDPTLARARRALGSLDAPEDRAEALADGLGRIVSEAPPVDLRTVRAVAAIESEHGVVTIRRVAEAVGLSERQLLRRFAEDVGITPKQLCRIRRFQRVFTAWRDDRRGWADVAVACGYFDQAHLIRDFTELGGGAPAGLLATMSDFTRAFTALGDEGVRSPG